MGAARADDQPRQGARRRHRRRSPDPRLGRRIGGRAARLSRSATSFFESHPQNAVLKAVMDLVGGDGKAFDAIELYSCFPCVPKMARRTLGLGPDVQPTVTGGLTFFGAPLNTYMTHAACAMVRKLRERRQARPALRPGRLCHQASWPGAVAAGAARAAGAGHQRTGGGRPPSRPRAGFRHRGRRQVASVEALP